MSRKDYQKIAEVFKFGYDFADEKQTRIINLMHKEICRVFKEDNPKFHYGKFASASGYVDTETLSEFFKT